MVLGEPGVGKSWLCRRVFVNKVPAADRETHDVELIRPQWKPRVGELEVGLSVWDFGGQHVLHGTHEMFLSQRPVAILVLDVTRSLQDNKTEYWQKLLCHCAGPETQSIIVVTKCDTNQHQIGKLEGNELTYGLAHTPAIIQGFSARAPLPDWREQEPASIKALRSAITTALGQIDELHKKVSPETARMKNHVERKIKDKSLISLNEYQRWCREVGVDDCDQSILRALHNFGSLFFFGLTEFEKQLTSSKAWLEDLPPGEQRLLSTPRDSILTKWIVNPRWLKWPIYEVVRQSANTQRIPQGVMSFREIKSFATQGTADKGLKMPPDGPTYVCKVLQLTGLCWEQKQDLYLFPRGLAKGTPYGCEEWTSVGWWEWGFFPEYAFHRFVVHMHNRTEVVQGTSGNWQHWRDAVVVEHSQGCRAVVLADPSRGRIEVRLDPASSEPAGFSDLCRFVEDVFENEIVKRAAEKK